MEGNPLYYDEKTNLNNSFPFTAIFQETDLIKNRFAQSIIILSIALLFCFGHSTSILAQIPNSNVNNLVPEYLQNRYIVKFKPNINTNNLSLNNQGVVVLGNSIFDTFSATYQCTAFQKLYRGRKHLQDKTYVLQFSPASTMNTEEFNNALMQTGVLLYAETDVIGSADGVEATFPTDVHFERQWALHNTGDFVLSDATMGADMKMPDAWDIEQGSDEVIVAIIDSGCNLEHAEFDGRIWSNVNEIPDNGIDDDENGYVDDVYSWNFSYDTNNPTDDNGHGTNVTGVIGSNANNMLGYAGVDWNCELMICKGLDSTNYGLYSWWAAAMIYAVDHGADVINMSLSGATFSTTLEDAVNYAWDNNVLVISSMGNSNTGDLRYPAAYEKVLAVGATDADDNRCVPFFWSATSGSNFGDHIDVVAPGNYIFSAGMDISNYNGYWGGTSQATPHVTGVASLLKAQNQSRTPQQISDILENTAEDQVGNALEDTDGWDMFYGHGRVNAYEALNYDNTPVASVRVKMKVFLEGLYDAGNQQMSSYLNQGNILPTNQPFFSVPWNYTGTETANSFDNAIVDWVLVEALNANMNSIEKRAAFLRSDGLLIDVSDGAEGVQFFTLAVDTGYQFIIRHRNHLDVFTANPITVPNATAYDLTDVANAGGTDQMQLLSGSTYGMYAGDINGDGNITVSDLNIYVGASSIINTYHDADCNSDGNVTVSDSNLYRLNSSIIGDEVVRF